MRSTKTKKIKQISYFTLFSKYLISMKVENNKYLNYNAMQLISFIYIFSTVYFDYIRTNI